MCIQPQQKIVLNKYTIAPVWVMFAKSYSAQLFEENTDTFLSL